MTARWVNVVLGAWLFISAFVWRHSDAQFTNTWVVGLLIVAAALLGIRYSWGRYINMGLAAWLFLSTLFFPRIASATLWNNLIVAIIVFAMAVAPTRIERRRIGGMRPART